jgi:hypothetical protein
MPMHDWTKVKPGIYHDFHNVWLIAIRHALNNGVLPSGYYALSEQRVATVEADVLALQSVGAKSPTGGRRAAKPAVEVLERAEKAPRPPRRRIVVRDEDHEVVAVIELVSPENVKEREEYAAFVGKAVDLLAAGIHLVIIDPFRPPPHAPAGLHADIWKMVAKRKKGRRPYRVPVGKPLEVVSYCASTSNVLAAVQPFAVGEPVPDIPLYLTADEVYVTVPLEATYQAAWQDVPKVWRDVLAS